MDGLSRKLDKMAAAKRPALKAHAVEAATPPETTIERLEEILKGVEVQIGLRQQGHIPTVEKMLAEGKSWDEIGHAIGWDGATAKEWYEAEALAASGPAASRVSEDFLDQRLKEFLADPKGQWISHEDYTELARRYLALRDSHAALVKEMNTLKARYAFPENQRLCTGYEVRCDGDLEGTTHEKECPAYKKDLELRPHLYKAEELQPAPAQQEEG